MPGMANRKKKDGPKGPTPRSGVPLYVYISDEMGEALERYLAESLPRVSKTSAVEAAMAAFLKERGYWPPKKSD